MSNVDKKRDPMIMAGCVIASAAFSRHFGEPCPISSVKFNSAAKCTVSLQVPRKASAADGKAVEAIGQQITSSSGASFSSVVVTDSAALEAIDRSLVSEEASTIVTLGDFPATPCPPSSAPLPVDAKDVDSFHIVKVLKYRAKTGTVDVLVSVSAKAAAKTIQKVAKATKAAKRTRPVGTPAKPAGQKPAADKSHSVGASSLVDTTAAALAAVVAKRSAAAAKGAAAFGTEDELAALEAEFQTVLIAFQNACYTKGFRGGLSHCELTQR